MGGSEMKDELACYTGPTARSVDGQGSAEGRDEEGNRVWRVKG